jgi:hypothetical protein
MKKEIRWRTVALLSAGVATGVVLASGPAGAHVGGTVDHLWSHLRPTTDARYVQKSSQAFAFMNRTGTLAPSRTKGFVSFTHPVTGIYCLRPRAGINPAKRVIMLTPEWSASADNDLRAYALASSGLCPKSTFAVATYQGGALSDFVAFYAFVP